jgi:ribosomal protein S27AE
VSAEHSQKKKACPRCGGNVFLDTDQYGWFEHCLRCGHTRDLSGGEIKSNARGRSDEAFSGEYK